MRGQDGTLTCYKADDELREDGITEDDECGERSKVLRIREQTQGEVPSQVNQAGRRLGGRGHGRRNRAFGAIDRQIDDVVRE